MKIIQRILDKNLKNFHLKIIENRNTLEKQKIPDRYRIKKVKDEELLTCIESPNIAVKIKRGFSVSLQNAKKYPERSIFLDGAAIGEPFLDNEKQIYNLDHHHNCERTFTLATCEQALILVKKGLNLSEKNWTIYANEPDLDTVFAIWLLLNHSYINNNDLKYYRKIVPLIRLEGVIDALGLDLADIIGYPQNFFRDIKNKIEKLREFELEIKKNGKWYNINYTEYTHHLLNLIDEIVFEIEDFKNVRGIIEIARAEINEDDSVVIYEGESGIYELEEYLNKIYLKKPTFVMLKKGKNHYSIRKTNLFSPLRLEKIYDRLNIFDKFVNGKEKGNRWGGSSQIGGSPRVTGTSLTPFQIVEICRNAFMELKDFDVFRMFLFLLGLSLFPLLLSWITLFSALYSPYLGHLIESPFSLKAEVFYFYVFLIDVSLFLFFFHNLHLFGFRYPILFHLKHWGILAIVLGLLSGIIFSYQTFLEKNWFSIFMNFILGPIVTVIFFFSFVHGILTIYFPIQKFDSKFFISKPNLFTAIYYAFTVLLLPFYQHPLPTIFHNLESLFYSLIRSVILFLYAIVLNIIKEKTESIYPVILVYLLNSWIFFFLIYHFLNSLQEF